VKHILHMFLPMCGLLVFLMFSVHPIPDSLLYCSFLHSSGWSRFCEWMLRSVFSPTDLQFHSSQFTYVLAPISVRNSENLAVLIVGMFNMTVNILMPFFQV
jgi:hypothetical protein